MGYYIHHHTFKVICHAIVLGFIHCVSSHYITVHLICLCAYSRPWPFEALCSSQTYFHLSKNCKVTYISKQMGL